MGLFCSGHPLLAKQLTSQCLEHSLNLHPGEAFRYKQSRKQEGVYNIISFGREGGSLGREGGREGGGGGGGGGGVSFHYSTHLNIINVFEPEASMRIIVAQLVASLCPALCMHR